MTNIVRLIVLMYMMLTLLVMSGCGGGTTKETTGTGDFGNINTNIVVPEADKDYVVQLGYYDCDHMTAACIAKDAGIYEALGLKVNVLGNGKVPEAMAAGQMDAGYVGNSGTMRAFLKGSPILVAANNHIGGSYYLVVSNEVGNAQNLVGKKLAIGTAPEKNSISWVLMAEELGIPITGDNYEVFDMSDKDEYFALVAGRLDGYTACDPWGSMAEYEKMGKVIAMQSTLPDGEWGECCAFHLSKNFAEKHPELASLMVLAHTKSLEYIYTTPVHSAEIFSDNYNVPLEVGLMTIYKKTVAEGRTLTWEIDRNYWQRQIDIELARGTLDAAPDVNEFIRTEYLENSGADDFDAFIKEKVDPVFPVGMSYGEWKTKAYQLEGKTSESV